MHTWLVVVIEWDIIDLLGLGIAWEIYTNTVDVHRKSSPRRAEFQLLISRLIRLIILSIVNQATYRCRKYRASGRSYIKFRDFCDIRCIMRLNNNFRNITFIERVVDVYQSSICAVLVVYQDQVVWDWSFSVYNLNTFFSSSEQLMWVLAKWN